MAQGEGKLLLRLDVESEQGHGDLRLVLNEGGDGFDLEARDGLGGPVWRLWTRGPRALFVDARRGTYCRPDPSRGMRWPEFTWEIPIRFLPALLRGAYPATSSGEGESEVRVGDRLFRGTRDGALWNRWTAWEGGEPSAWWRREGEVAELDLRTPPVRLRWRVVGRADAATAPREEPDVQGLSEVECLDGQLP